LGYKEDAEQFDEDIRATKEALSPISTIAKRKPLAARLLIQWHLILI